MKLTNQMSDKHVARWAATHAKGKWFFLVRTSVLFGVGMFLSNLRADWLWGDSITFKVSHLVINLIFGVIVAFALWRIGDTSYKNSIRSKQDGDTKDFSRTE